MSTEEIRPYGRRSPRTYVSVALQLRRRLAAVAWLMQQGITYVPPGTAARVLGVSKSRVSALIRSGRVRVVEGMPGGSVKDRWVPVVDLAAAPTPLEAGRARGWHIGHRIGRGDVPDALWNEKNATTRKNL